jgi:hypothetical protein
MADTIFQSAMQGYQSGIDTLNYKQQSDDQTSILSDKAQESKIKLAADKEYQAKVLASRATLADQQRKNADANMGDLAGSLKIFDAAIGAVKKDPEQQQILMQQRGETLSQMASIATTQAKVREETSNQLYDDVRGGLLSSENPSQTFQQMADATTDQKTKSKLSGLAHIMDPNSTIPVPGYKKPYSQLTSEEQQTFKADVTRAFAPQKSEKTAADIMSERLKADETERKRQHDLEQESWENKRTAAQREKAEVASIKARDKSEAMEKAEDRYTKMRDRMETELYGDGSMAHPGIPETIKNPESSMFNSKPAEIPNPAYDLKKKALIDLDKTHEDRMAKLQAADQTPEATKEDRAITTFGSYEPDKYNYGINPETGNFARKPKTKGK